MRLICPNCGAQYEVADDVMPEGGRDVQCSNCGHTWFEQPGALASAENEYAVSTPDVEATVEPETVEAEPDPEPISEPEPETAPEEFVAPEASAETEPEPAGDAETSPDPVEEPQQQQLDPEIAAILQEEAARETAARAAEADTGLESQPELGIDAVSDLEAQRSDEARKRMASMRGEPDATDAAIAATLAEGGSRRELLPDIEEINSSLTPDEHRDEGEPVAEAVITVRRKRSGFRLGFGLVLLLVAIAVLVYAMAPQIIKAMPGAEPALTSYVNMMNEARIWLDSKVQSTLEWLTNAAGTE